MLDQMTKVETEAQKEQILRGFAEGLEVLGDLPELEDPESLGRAAALTLARPGLWEEQLGPLLTGAQARGLLGGISREALSQRVRRGTLLALRDERGRVRYPLVQFDEEEGAVRGEIPTLVRAFRERELSGWELAAFLTTAQPELGNDSPAGWMRAGGEPELLLAVAREAAERLSR